MPKELSSLEPVELREIWRNERPDFTTWLAEEENLALLAETLNLDLETEAQEINVGDFSADLVCRNTADNSRVLIENQLTRTDHTHLGQILTYAAGLEVGTIIWIAQRFRDGHRAALDWLNRITTENFRFFGVEIELWQIGDSLPAPKFNIVSKPNDWSRAMKESDDTQPQWKKFWTQLREYMIKENCKVQLPNPTTTTYLHISRGRTSFRLEVWLSKQYWRISVQLRLSEPHALVHFRLLEEQREEIESEFGESLEWDEMPNHKSSKIVVYRSDTDLMNESDWPNQHEWVASNLEKFNEVFPRRIQIPDASDWQPEDDETDQHE